MATHAWILQVKGEGPKQQFRLEQALSEALKRDRELWLAPEKTVSFDGPEHPVGGDRVYLNVSGEKAALVVSASWWPSRQRWINLFRSECLNGKRHI
jgi:hypothetical protein